MRLLEAIESGTLRQYTIIVFLLQCALLAGWDLAAALNDDNGDTLSEVIRSWNYYGVMFFLWLFLGWHFFWNWSAWR